MAALGYRTTPTPTPTDSWSSYFDSWRNEDKQVPAFEPMIVDEDLHPDSLNVKFNFTNLDYDLDWEMDLSQDPNDRKIMYDASERVHQRRQHYYHHVPSPMAKQQSPQHAYGHQQHHNPRQVFRNVNNAKRRAPDHRRDDVDRFNWTLESAVTAPTAPVRGTSLGANLNSQWLEEPNLKNFIRHGKQARAAELPRDQPTTNVSPVHAQPQKYHHGISEPAPVRQHQHQNQVQPHPGEYSAAAIDNRNVAAQAGGVAANQQGKQQKIHAADIEALVAEERERAGKMPRYPGLERYILIEKMGDGAFSNVYKARDTTTHDEVAIKVVRKFEMNSNQRANILKEVQIMRQLDHPNIVKLIDFSESRQYYYIVLELCPGGELFHQIVRLTYFSEDLSRHVITQVAKALLYLHEECGVVHRDIKPENLLFYPVPFIPSRNPKPRGPDEEDKADEGEFVPGVGAGGIGQIKIADFGLSKVIWDSQTMTPCGTVGYTAPEIVKDERYSKSVDMWALGCVLYTLLCGFPPFYDESIQVLTEKVARGQYTFLSPWWDDISKSAQDLVSHLLTVNPEQRFTIEQFLAHPWIRNTQEPTYAASDAPPLATPLAVRQKEWNQAGGAPDLYNALQTPGTPGRRADFRSPGAVNLREVFDVGYAVHRQEEEAKRRKNFKQGYRGGGLPGGLNPLNEDDDDYEDDDYEEEVSSKVPKAQQPADVSSMEAKMRSTNLGSQPSTAAQARSTAAAPARSQHHSQQQQQQERGYGQHSAAVAAAAKRDVGRRNKQPFELSLDNSTLLGRRNKGPGVGGNAAPSKLREELSVR
ncbi:MAPK-activated protein kinase Srk1 [Exophiala sideris]|uniref:MAPK-activated protein kinase Srk1 n=1 Tax=Exophiala sideris TaxID=1016849 RepID=A0ABR0J0H9_9EURO|nr:MAPK-activated protein kinase Srk1 [Exophiala sideris]